MMSSVCGWLFGVRCVLSGGCWLLFVACCWSLLVVCCLMCVVSLLCAGRCAMSVVRCVVFVVCCLMLAG